MVRSRIDSRPFPGVNRERDQDSWMSCIINMPDTMLNRASDFLSLWSEERRRDFIEEL